MTGGFGRFVLRGVGDRNTRSIMVDVGGTFVLPVDVTGGSRCQRAAAGAFLLLLLFLGINGHWSICPHRGRRPNGCLLLGLCLYAIWEGGGGNLECLCSCILFLGDTVSKRHVTFPGGNRVGEFR